MVHILRGRESVGSVAILFGVLFPIDVLGGVNPLFIDILRYILALVLIVSIQSKSQTRNEIALIGAILLLCLNLVSSIRALLADNTEIALQSIIGFISIIFAYLVTRNAFLNRKMLTGFLIGAVWSALDIILQVAGLPYLGTTTDWGTRYPGLGLSSTNTAPFLALGLVLVISNFLWKRSTPMTILRVVAGIILATGLLFSGGRGGIAGITLAIVVFLVVQLRNRPIFAIFSGTIGIAWFLAEAPQIANFLTRDGSDSGFATGRAALNAAAWNAFTQGGPFGIDLATRVEYRPHTPILSFALSTGALGLVATVCLIGFLVWRLFHTPSYKTTDRTLVRMMAAVILVATLLEPWGFFIGLAKGIILMMTYGSQVDHRTMSGSHDSATLHNQDRRNHTPPPVV